MASLKSLKYLPVLLGALSLAAPAGAIDATMSVTVHDTKVALPAPEGFCWLSKDKPADAQILQVMDRVNSGRNIVLAMFAPCKDMAAFRAGTGMLSLTGAYMAPTSAAKKRISMPRAKFTAMMAGFFKNNAMKAEIEKAQNEAKQRVNDADAGATLDKNVNLGLIHQDGEGAYIAAIQTMQIEGGDRTRIATVMAMTLTGGKAVNISLSGGYSGQASVDGLLARQRENVKRLIATN